MFIQYFRSSPLTNVFGSEVVLTVVYVVYLCVIPRQFKDVQFKGKGWPCLQTAVRMLIEAVKVALEHHKCVRIHLSKSHSSHPWCCGSAGWLVLCAVTLSPCTTVELISLSLQLMITCSMRQYNILQSAVSSLASFQRAQCPLEPSCTLRYTGLPFICLWPLSVINNSPFSSHHQYQ